MAAPSRALIRFAALGIMLAGAVVTSAATFVVDSTFDLSDASPGDGVCEASGGPCTLRAAIEEANALAGADDVTLPAETYKMTLALFDNGFEFDVTGDLTINGTNAGTTFVDGNCLAFAGAPRVFHVRPGAVVRISGITVQNGCPSARGAGIYNEGDLTLTDSVVRDNTSGLFFPGPGPLGGGGIGNVGTLVVRRTSVRDNQTAVFGGNGGGILNEGSATIDASVVSGNDATGGGGIYSNIGALTVQNSTVSGNFAAGFDVTFPPPPCESGGYGGGIFGHGTLAYVTIANNTARAGDNVPGVCSPGGGAGLSGTFTLDSSIIQNGNPSPMTDCDGTMTSLGHNIAGDASCALAGTGDLNSTDALLGPLAANGGPTQTHRLLAGSSAIDTANGATCPATDQRGIVRPHEGGCDRGAFETTGPCGNGMLDPGETCDDGNDFAGDCCSASCQLESAGSPCPDDADVCTDDVCDGAGTCTHPNNTAPCSDGNPCTTGDTCAGGVCVGGGPACDPCEACGPGGSCTVPVTLGCQAAAARGAHVVVTDSSNNTKDVLVWRWRSSGIVTPANLGDPTAGTGYRLCVIDDGALALSIGIPSGGAWASASNGWKLVDPAFPPAGMLRMRLKALASGKGTIALRRRRGSIGNPGLPFDLPVTVRLLRSDAPICWESTASTATRNAGGRFRATSD